MRESLYTNDEFNGLMTIEVRTVGVDQRLQDTVYAEKVENVK